MKYLLIVRHCEAIGQEPEAELTASGKDQAKILAEVLKNYKITRIVSSPYLRAVQSIKLLAERLDLEIETDLELIEAGLSSSNIPNWLDHLRDTFTNYELCLEGGESSAHATKRVTNVIDGILGQLGDEEATLIVSHGRLIALLLKHFNNEMGFEDWLKLSNPDVFEIKLDTNSGPIVQNIWQNHQTTRLE